MRFTPISPHLARACRAPGYRAWRLPLDSGVIPGSVAARQTACRAIWIPIGGILLSIVATVIGKRQASLMREALLLTREKSGAGPSDPYPWRQITSPFFTPTDFSSCPDRTLTLDVPSSETAGVADRRSFFGSSIDHFLRNSSVEGITESDVGAASPSRFLRSLVIICQPFKCRSTIFSGVESLLNRLVAIGNLHMFSIYHPRPKQVNCL